MLTEDCVCMCVCSRTGSTRIEQFTRKLRTFWLVTRPCGWAISVGHPVSGEVNVLQMCHKSARLAAVSPYLPCFYFFKVKMLQVFMCNPVSHLPSPPAELGRENMEVWVGLLSHMETFNIVFRAASAQHPRNSKTVCWTNDQRWDVHIPEKPQLGQAEQLWAQFAAAWLRWSKSARFRSGRIV